MQAKQQSRLNPYIITWVSLIPVKGLVTLKDMRKCGAIHWFTSNEILFHNGNKETALLRISKLCGKLSKEYLVVMYTDKQFAMRKYGDCISIVLTRKQMEEAFIITPNNK